MLLFLLFESGRLACAAGQLIAWGSNDKGQLNAPAGLTNVVAVAASDFVNLALRADGTAAVWGTGFQGNPDPPPEFSQLVAIAAGYGSAFGVRADGQVVDWNSSGLLVVAGFSDCTTVGRAGTYIFALRRDGTVLGWDGPSGSGLGSFQIPNTGVITALSGALNSDALLMLGANSRVTTWTRPVLGSGMPGPQLVPGLSNVVAIARRWSDGFALRQDGVTFRWLVGFTNSPQVVASNVVSIADGFALQQDGAVVCVASPGFYCPPFPPGHATNLVALSAGADHVLAIATDTAPTFSRQPAVQTLVKWQPLLLNANAVGIPEPAYQWFRNGIPINGATNRILTVHQPTPGDSGAYHVAASNRVGSATSGSAQITVLDQFNSTTEVVAWGSLELENAPPTVPGDLTNIVAISAGRRHSLALRANGEAVAWGNGRDSEFGQSSVPTGLSNVVAISAGRYHNLALRADRTVTAWGFGAWGQTTVPAAATNIVAVSAGGLMSCALRADGVVLRWGYDGEGLGPSNIVAVPSYAENPSFLNSDGVWVGLTGWMIDVDAVQVAGADDHVLSLRSDGTVSNVPLGNGNSRDSPNWLADAIQISAHGKHNLALRRNGTVVGWGANGYGQALVPSGLTNVLAVAAGYSHSLALGILSAPVISRDPSNSVATTATRLVLSVSAEGFPPPTYRWQKNGVPIPNATGRVLVIASVRAADEGSYSVTVRNKVGTVTSNPATVTVTGDSPPHSGIIVWNSSGLLSAPLLDDAFSFTSAAHAIALRRNGSIIRWRPQDLQPVFETGRTDVAGIAFYGALLQNGSAITLAGAFSQSTPQLLFPQLNDAVVLGDGGSPYLGFVRVDGTVTFWGGADSPANLTNVTALATGSRQALALHADGSISVHQTVFSPLSPDLVLYDPPLGLSNVIRVSASGDRFMALRSDGKLFAWGEGQTGITNLPPHFTNVASMLLAGASPLVLTRDGIIFTFASTNEDGVFTNRWLPVPPTETQGAIDIGNSAAFNFALVPLRLPVWTQEPGSISVSAGSRVVIPALADGLPPPIYQWFKDGRPVPGAAGPSLFLAEATPEDAGTYYAIASNAGGDVLSTPVQLSVTGSLPTRRRSTVTGWGRNSEGQLSFPSPLTNVIESAAGDSHGLALLADRRLLAWGRQIGGLADPPFDVTREVVGLAAGRFHSLSLRNSGSVTGWGSNTNLQLAVPLAATQVVSVAAGATHSLALRADGRVVGWGGATIDLPFASAAARAPTGLSNVVAIAAGVEHSVALTAEGKVVVWGSNRTVPTDLTNVWRIAAGGYHTVALLSNGTVRAWLPPLPPSQNFGQTQVPKDLSNVVAIAAGQFHSLALKADGRIVAWGAGSPGSTGNVHYGQSTVPLDLPGAFGIAGGGYHSLALVPTLYLAPELNPVATPGRFLIRLSGEPHQLFVLERSSDLESWLPLPEGVLPDSGSLLYEADVAQTPIGFVRARLR